MKKARLALDSRDLPTPRGMPLANARNLSVGRAAESAEAHRSARAGWLRAAVLGSSDAIVSTSSLMIGVAASSAGREAILIAGLAGLAAGAMSMAVGEYVSVSSQRDAERADIKLEKSELFAQPEAELRELAQIYEKRGLDPELAKKVALQLSAKDVLAAHVRDELGFTQGAGARPLQAAGVSALSFGVFAMVPIIGLLIASPMRRLPAIASVSLLSLAALGALGAHLGGAPRVAAALRVTVGGSIAMLVTAAVGRIVGLVLG